MRLSIKHTVTCIYTRNGFAEAINAKNVAIELKGNVLQEIKKEVMGSKKVTGLSKIGKGIGAVGVTLGLLSPAGYIGLGGAAIYALIFGASSVASHADEINKYVVYSFYHKGEDHILLIRKKEFDTDLDFVEGYEDVVFSKSNSCPRCNKKGRKLNESFICPSCNRKIIKNSPAGIKM